jgi:hypothetical protein
MTFGSFGYGMNPHGTAYGMNPYGMAYNPTMTGAGMGQSPFGGAGFSGYGAPGAGFPGYGGFGMPGYGFGLPAAGFGFGWPGYGLGLGGLGLGPPSGWGFGGLGGLQPSGRTVSEQYLSSGLPSDTDMEEMIYDAIDVDPLIPADAQIDITCEAGTCTLSGEVSDKMVKHAAGQDAWWTTGVIDVVNNLQVTGKGPARSVKARMSERHAQEEASQPSGRAAHMAHQGLAQQSQR